MRIKKMGKRFDLKTNTWAESYIIFNFLELVSFSIMEGYPAISYKVKRRYSLRLFNKNTSQFVSEEIKSSKEVWALAWSGKLKGGKIIILKGTPSSFGSLKTYNSYLSAKVHCLYRTLILKIKGMFKNQ